MLLKAGLNRFTHISLWCLMLQTPMESAGRALVPNPSWFYQDLSSFSSVLCWVKGVGNHGT